ncbi:MAG TPA: cobalamin-binding protein, partial [Isosphaeraceae bacterium]|nr:cobalamin-binding protein [Isosphaeraceae bacterium]
MRIVSLLPSLTELVCALGHRSELVGVTHECDYPEGIDRLRHLTRSRIPVSASSAEIDTLVQAQAGSLYDLDADLLARLEPDLILTQSQCDVCAVNERTVRDVAQSLPGAPHVESVNPTSLSGVFAMFRRVGELIGAGDEAEALIARFDSTAAEISGRLPSVPHRRVVLLEWFDAPFASGHWNPELIALAGGHEAIGQAGLPSRRLTWDELDQAEPEVILLSPCGFPLGRTEAELPRLQQRPEWARLRAVREGAVAIIDGSSFFSRPGPRLGTSLCIAAAAIHPGQC